MDFNLFHVKGQGKSMLHLFTIVSVTVTWMSLHHWDAHSLNATLNMCNISLLPHNKCRDWISTAVLYSESVWLACFMNMNGVISAVYHSAIKYSMGRSETLKRDGGNFISAAGPLSRRQISAVDHSALISSFITGARLPRGTEIPSPDTTKRLA